MSLLTSFLNLFKYEPDPEGLNTFDIDKALNENWDKVDAGILAAHKYYYVTNATTGVTYKCHDEIKDGKPTIVYEEVV